MTGAKGRWKRALLNKIVNANAAWDDAAISPVIRQTLLHWCAACVAARRVCCLPASGGLLTACAFDGRAYEVTEADVLAHAK